MSVHRVLRRLFAILLLVCLVIGSLYYSPDFDLLPHLTGPREDDTTSQENSLTPPVLVLIWVWPFGKPFDLNSCRSEFNIEGCHLTADRGLYSEADAVLIHHRDIEWDLSNLPKSARPPLQKWVWVNFESPSNSAQLPGLENLFNLTLNYQRDADITLPYGSIISTSHKGDFVPPKKNKLLCWIVSNWKPEHGRVHYYYQLRKYIDIYTFGSHFYRPVSKKGYKKIVASCKFYLSFENSVHKDYITEKLYNALELGAVPVVFGPPRENYERFIPRDAFIHVEDFPTVKALAKHLYFLDQNEDMYHRYFHWRRHFEAKTTTFPMENACHTCDYIRRHKENQAVANLYQWYWGETEGLEPPYYEN